MTTTMTTKSVEKAQTQSLQIGSNLISRRKIEFKLLLLPSALELNVWTIRTIGRWSVKSWLKLFEATGLRDRRAMTTSWRPLWPVANEATTGIKSILGKMPFWHRRNLSERPTERLSKDPHGNLNGIQCTPERLETLKRAA